MEPFLFISYFNPIEFCLTIPLVKILENKLSVHMNDSRLQMVRKLAHDVNGPLGNATAFIDLALQQFSDVISKEEENGKNESIADLKMGVEFLKLSVPSIVQLQRNMRMWSALHQIVVEEYGVQLRRVNVSEFINTAYSQLEIFLNKKKITYEVEGTLSNELIADAELLGLITFFFFDLAVATVEKGSVVTFSLTEDTSSDEIHINVRLNLDANYPLLAEQLSSRFSKDLSSLPENFEQGIIKPLAYGSIFVPTAVEAMGGTFNFSIDNKNTLTCDMKFNAN